MLTFVSMTVNVVMPNLIRHPDLMHDKMWPDQ